MSTVNPALEKFIRSIPLFSFVEASDMNDVLRLLRPVELKAGETLFTEGEPGKAMWILGEGTELSISRLSVEKKPLIVAFAKAGDVVGEMSLVDDGPRSGTATVTQGGPAHQIDAQEFYAIRAMFIPAAFKVLRKISNDLCARLRHTNERIVPSGESGIQAPPLPKGPRPSVELLAKYPPFQKLSAVVKLALSQKLEIVQLSEITPIFAEGERADGAYFILEGEVSVGRNGKTLANLQAGSMFGLVACIDLGTRSASCITTGPALLLKMSDTDFDSLFSMGHRVAFLMVDLVARQLVNHVREANSLLPPPSKGPAKGVQKVAPVVAAPDEEVIQGEEILEMEDALPIELELDLVEGQPVDSI